MSRYRFIRAERAALCWLFIRPGRRMDTAPTQLPRRHQMKFPYRTGRLGHKKGAGDQGSWGPTAVRQPDHA